MWLFAAQIEYTQMLTFRKTPGNTIFSLKQEQTKYRCAWSQMEATLFAEHAVQRLQDLGHRDQPTPFPLPMPGFRVTGCHLNVFNRNISSDGRQLRN